MSTTNKFCLVGIGANTVWIFSKGRYGLFINRISVCNHIITFVFSYLLDKMNRIFVPIFFIYPVLLSVEIQLIHSECYQNVFGLPQFFIRVPVRHTYGLYHVSTSRIVYIVCSCDIRNARLFQHADHCPTRFGTNSFVPKLFPDAIAQIVAVVFAYMDTADRYIVFFQTNGVIISRIFLCIEDTLLPPLYSSMETWEETYLRFYR